MSTITAKLNAISALVDEIRGMAGDSNSVSSASLTPLQKLQKRLEKKSDDLAALNSKTKSKSPDKDAEKVAKLTEEISKLNEKIAEAEKPVEKKPRKKTVKAEKSADAVDGSSDEDAEKPAEKPVVEKPAKAEKRVTRLTGAQLTQFKSAFTSAKVEFDDSHKKAFAEYANSLTADEFAAIGLADHMTAFVATLVKTVTVLTVANMRSQAKDLEEVSVGVYRNKTTSQVYNGPGTDDDEDLGEVTHDGKEYFVGEKSQRVYETIDGKDVFVGHWGVAKFYEADL